ncbi:MAG TPA: protein kinase, partial [Polyangiaceae bacterium]|nr:protein kinase [Polyangiaceae bacterium]
MSVPEGGESTLPRRPTRSASSAASPTPSSLAQPASGSLSVEGAALTKEILEELETQRAKVFFRVTTGLTLLVLAALPFLPGAAWLRAMTAAFCFVASLVSVFVVVRATKKTYTPEVALATGLVLIPLAIAIIYYLGLFSAAATLLAVGIYFFGSSQVRKVAWATYLACAILYFVVTLLIAVSALPDHSVFSVEHVATMSRLYRVIMQQAIFGMTFYLARSTRRANEIALERAQRTDLELKRTEAQLLEAKGELDRALRPGEGRWTGQHLDTWLLGELLGRGGMGEVYAARKRDGTDLVAIKLLHPQMLENPDNVARFMREAKATASVPSEHVAAVIEVATSQAGIPYIVMELLEGHDLAWYLRRSPQLELPQVVEMVEHTARALSAVRAAGIVHRDLKPGNLFLTDTLPRRWKV